MNINNLISSQSRENLWFLQEKRLSDAFMKLCIAGTIVPRRLRIGSSEYIDLPFAD